MSGYADNDYDSDCDYYDYDDDYIYAEAGGFDLADELASGVLPDAPALYYRDDEVEEYDNYNFWSELEYGNGEIYDQDTPLDRQIEDDKPRDKRKKSKASEIKDTLKNIRLRGIQDYPTVLWEPWAKAFSLHQPCPIYDKPQKPVAILPNWRQLLKDQPAMTITSPVSQPQPNVMTEEQEEGDWEDMSEDQEEEDEDEEADGDMALRDIDPDLLKSALAAKLSSSGMTGLDQSAFMESIMQMMAGGAGADTNDLLESLTSTLVNQVAEGGTDSSMAQWLSGQGVSLEEASEAEEENVNRSVVDTATSKDSSPKDSVAADLPAAPKPSETIVEDLLDAKPEQSAGRKRKQASPDETKRPSNGAAGHVSEVLPAEETSSKKRIRRANTKATAPTAASNSVKAKPIVAELRTSRPDRKTPTISKPSEASTKSDETKQTKPARLQNGHNRAKLSTTTEPTKPASLKRKASEEPSDDKPKRQLRNFAAPTASSQNKAAEVKITRSGRARK